ncbi:MAG: ABC transporter permease [Gammaproteobacteria bacterium]|nr:ABC transporter permease [Gammaproteobacteria bacterium]MCW8840729.1 ABC transporter permease [Gammaproteobacteria bacterium]MCW8928590.1 ABC transporter permease [Gammaproteobacteria bacterium]MCW8958348.1 ABC transporter permease [Gammaproteobacteria bacterium]MCW8972608.1 ABC transporter permease [Gammaproteobacteria bacterium]
MHEILTVARKEFRDGLRNRWVLAITVLFALFALGLAYFGAAVSGQVGFTSLDTTIVSLASLAIFVIPLIALLLAYDSLVGEAEMGTLMLLLSYPLSRFQLLTGKFMGHAMVMAFSSVLGFGLAALTIGVLTGEADSLALWKAFGLFILSAVLLGWVFVSLAYLVSALSSEKSRAAGLALIVWFMFVLVFDLALLGVLVATEGGVNETFFPYLLMLNPADVFRMINLAGFEAAEVYTGMAAFTSGQLSNIPLLIVVLLLWSVAPLALASWVFNRRLS